MAVFLCSAVAILLFLATAAVFIRNNFINFIRILINNLCLVLSSRPRLALTFALFLKSFGVITAIRTALHDFSYPIFDPLYYYLAAAALHVYFEVVFKICFYKIIKKETRA